MAMISDPNYVLHAIRLSALRTTDDPVTPRIITLDPAFGLDPYISTMGLGDVDRWPEIKRALDSPPPERVAAFDSDDDLPDLSRQAAPLPSRRGATGLRYTQTIMGGRTGGAGMRVSGRRDGESLTARRALRGDQRSKSSSTDNRPSMPPRPQLVDDVFTPRASRATRAASRPRSGSEPVPAGVDVLSMQLTESPVARSMGMSETTSGSIDDDGASAEIDTDGDGTQAPSLLGTIAYDPDGSSMGAAASALPSDLAMTAGDSDPLAGEAVDEGSDVDEDEVVDEDEAVPVPPVAPALGRRPTYIRERGQANRVSTIHEEDRRSSTDTNAEPRLEFSRQSLAPPPTKPASALTAALNVHVPHLVSTGAGATPPAGGPTGTGGNPFTSLYASVAAPSTVPSITLDLFFPHSEDPSDPIRVKVRKDATVEEVVGHGLYKYWDEGREPKLDDEGDFSTVGWGLRIVEDDGEVDEDFPALDRESQISKFSYGEFGIVRATESQKKQNAAMAPLIQRRPSRIITDPMANKVAPGGRRPPGTPSSPIETLDAPPLGTTIKSGVGLSSATSKQVLLRVRANASADVHFTTTISVPSDMYIADLTEVLVHKKQLPNPPSEWVLCLADLTLALPLDRTVASLEGKTELCLVRRQWALQYGLRTNDRRGGDPSASIFKRISEPMPLARFGPVGDLGQGYKKYTVQRKTPIGRHERVLAIDGDYIHIMPSENRAFFDSMKTTSFHITLVASCKLSGRSGGFKIYVWRDGNRKRYEFEAENGKQAAEIIGSIKQLMKACQVERNSVAPSARATTTTTTTATRR